MFKSSNQIKSNQIKSNQIKSNQIKPDNPIAPDGKCCRNTINLKKSRKPSIQIKYQKYCSYT